MKIYDLIGIGIGPFNLSLAALLPDDSNVLFLDNKPEFSWHQELMFKDASMQTSYLKDLVTPVDPTNKYSFLNYLAENGQFYHFLNTDRKNVTRIEFEAYCRWASEKLGDKLRFNARVDQVKFEDGIFVIEAFGGEKYLAKDICVASGPVKNIPECAKPFVGHEVFHAKSRELQNLNVEGKRVLIVGGGQTGVEIFRNLFNNHRGRARSVSLISGRDNLRPLDEGPFTNEIFTPDFVSKFYYLDQGLKDQFTENLLLASDGNTPCYLQELYNELYLEKFYRSDAPECSIMPMRWLSDVKKIDGGYGLTLRNLLSQKNEEPQADIVILATGFRSELPKYLAPIEDLFCYDQKGRLEIEENYKLKTKLNHNNIFAMNFSRHGHGIADPQTSLMSWRSAIIANSIMQEDVYKVHAPQISFLNFFN